MLPGHRQTQIQALRVHLRVAELIGGDLCSIAINRHSTTPVLASTIV